VSPVTAPTSTATPARTPLSNPVSGGGLSAGAAGPASPGGSGNGLAAAGWRRPLRRLADQRRTTPGRLRLILLGLITLGLVAGLLTGLTAAGARAGTAELGERAQPLLIEAETVWSALADADTTAAQAFLAGGLEPAELTRRYEDDLRRASAALAEAARLTPARGPAADAIRGLTTGLPEYAELVSTARANNRQGLPVGASYLATASQLSRATLQPQAEVLLREAESAVSGAYAEARSTGLLVVLMLVLLALIAALVLTQRHLSRTTHRTFNVPLVAATAVTVALTLGAAGVLSGQRGHLSAAEEHGSRPIGILAEARILALQERSDEALTLVARAGSGEHEADFAKKRARLDALLGELVRIGGGDQRFRDAADGQFAYVSEHEQVRRLDDAGSYTDAVKRAIGAKATATFAGVTDNLGAALEEHKDRFTYEAGAARDGLGWLAWLGPLLSLLICALALTGLRARLEEYR
jgi:hypothetical protein